MCVHMRGRHTVESQRKSAESAETIAEKKSLSRKIGVKRFSMQSHHFLKLVVHHWCSLTIGLSE